MDLRTIGLIALVAFVVGILADRIWIALRGEGELKKAQNPIPEPLESLPSDKLATVQIHLEEWKEIIATQRHFNDLIIRFRAFTLTAFATLVGAAVTLGEVARLDQGNLQIVMTLPIAFWLAALGLDLGYYHRLLLGSVAEASKFDNHELFQAHGLFGMTEGVKHHVRPITARALVLLYYLVPLVVVGGLIVWRLT